MTFLWDLPEILRSSLTMIWKLIAIPFRVIACTSDTLFSENLSRKNCNYNLFPSEDTVTNPEVLLVLNAVRIFLSLPTPTTSLTSLPFFINTFGFAGWAVFLSKSYESKSRRLITYQFYLSLSYQFGCQQKKMVMKLILVANVFKLVDTRPKDRL